MAYGTLRTVPLRAGERFPAPSRPFCCFFLVEHLCERAFMRGQAQALLSGRCSEVDFFGAQSREWELAFDLLEMELHPGENDLNIVPTGVCLSLDEFADALDLALSLWSASPFDVCLLYDNAERCREVLNRICPQSNP